MSKQVKKPGIKHLPKCKTCNRPVDDARREECGACAAGKKPSYIKKKIGNVTTTFVNQSYWEEMGLD